MADELKPCPFCGGKAERITIAEPGDNYGGDVICCTRCQASSHVEFGRKENLVDRWNRRPEPKLPPVERLARRFEWNRNYLQNILDSLDLELVEKSDD